MTPTDPQTHGPLSKKEALSLLRSRIPGRWIQGEVETERGCCLIGHLNHIIPPNERTRNSPYEQVLSHIIAKDRDGRGFLTRIMNKFIKRNRKSFVDKVEEVVHINDRSGMTEKTILSLIQ